MMRLDMSFAVALAAVGLATAPVAAQVTTESSAIESPSAQATGDSVGALPGIVRVGVATPMARGGAVSAFAGYGFLGSILGLEDSHHRASGQLSATLRLADWVGFGVRFDGRYDKHTTSDGSDDGYVGDPRIVARAIRDLGNGLVLGGQANLWMPGSEAPSVVASAISVEALAMATYAAPSSPLSVSANLGFRLDNSAEAVEDPMTLSLADRLALGLSESNAILMGGGLTYRAGKAEVLAEATYEYYLGDLAPPPSRSPLEVAAGLRYHIADNLQVQAYARARATKDPIIRIDSPLVAVSPRFGAMAGLHLQFGGPKPPTGPLVVDDKGTKDPVDDSEPAEPGTVKGRIMAGGAPISDAVVTINVNGEEVESLSSGDGDYIFEKVPGTITTLKVVVEAGGFKKSTTEVTIKAGGIAKHDVELDRILPPGQIKGVVRDFRGQPVIAKVKILPLGTEVEPDGDGVFTVEVAPGEYEVVVEHPNYRPQRKQVRVEEGTTTILNLDLQKP